MALGAILSGIIGLAIIAVFVTASRLSYAIEVRSGRHESGRLRRTNIWAVAMNIGIARDEETQALRRKLLTRLGIVALLFVVLAFIAAGIFPTASS
jgi:hypothetical protein